MLSRTVGRSGKRSISVAQAGAARGALSLATRVSATSASPTWARTVTRSSLRCSRRATATRAAGETVSTSCCQSSSLKTSVASRKGQATESMSWAILSATSRGRKL